ncbi:APC family permease [Natrinema hispanicum]|uniref:Amino acid transporter n=1 Tax=Natrinema hispanicum TaxID=392421 RepID=A0A1I0JP09_9EURY|nr:APC family permease [Natrinema hispanicum]SDD74940.1 Amino acid transporter [Natrinema hispanicum]SEU12340.1 Amino acid transporter [Natrinema hispanicum]
MSEGTGSDLSRELGIVAVFTLTTGTMLGAGIFVLPGPAAEGAGSAAALSFGLAGLIALVATMCAVELATAMPKSGGSYYFTSRAMGPLIGTVVGFGTWLSLVFKGSFALVGLGWYVTEFSAVPILGVAVVGGFLLTVLNWVGAEKSSWLQNLIVGGLVVILGIFVGKGLFATDRTLWQPFTAGGVGGVVATTGLVFISYLGVVKATAVAEEVKDPGTTLPRALFSAVVFVTFLYVAIMLIITGVMPLDDIAESTAPIADAGRLFLGALGGAVVAIAGIFATVSTANAAVLSASRFPFAMSRDGLVTPKLRQRSSRFETPTWAVWLTGGVMITLVLAFRGDVEGLAKIGGTFGILVFALLNLTVVLLRSAQPEWYEPAYRVPFSPWLPLAGAVAALLLLPFMGRLSQVAAVVFVLFGIGWYAVQLQVGEPVEPDHDIRDLLLGAQYRQSIEEKASKSREFTDLGSHVLVETFEGETNPLLCTLMNAFAEEFDADLEVLAISKIPPQTPIVEPVSHADADWKEPIESAHTLDRDEHTVSFEQIRTHDRGAALIDAIREKTELVLIDWHDPIRKYHFRESHVDEILRSPLPVRLAVLKYRETGDIEDIVVAAATNPYDRAEIELADAVAAATDARLTLVKAIDEEAAEEAETSAREYLTDLAKLTDSPTETELLRTDDVDCALVKRANAADLLVMGGPTRPDRIREFFGQTTDFVPAETTSSVLVVKEPGVQVPLSRRIWRWLSRPD